VPISGLKRWLTVATVLIGAWVRIGVGYVARVDVPHLCACLELCGPTGICVSVAVSPCAALEEVPAWRWR
jgi:hypothetical protein